MVVEIFPGRKNNCVAKTTAFVKRNYCLALYVKKLNYWLALYDDLLARIMAAYPLFDGYLCRPGWTRMVPGNRRRCLPPYPCGSEGWHHTNINWAEEDPKGTIRWIYRKAHPSDSNPGPFNFSGKGHHQTFYQLCCVQKIEVLTLTHLVFYFFLNLIEKSKKSY